jgi:hypothetical protein
VTGGEEANGNEDGDTGNGDGETDGDRGRAGDSGIGGVLIGCAGDVVTGAAGSGWKNPMMSCNEVTNFANPMTQIPTMTKKDASLWILQPIEKHLNSGGFFVGRHLEMLGAMLHISPWIVTPFQTIERPRIVNDMMAGSQFPPGNQKRF